MPFKAGNFQGSLQNESVEPFFENSQNQNNVNKEVTPEIKLGVFLV